MASRGAGGSGYGPLLRNRNFLLLWLGQFISQVGDYLYAIALMAVVLKLTRSATYTGLVLACAFAPHLFFGMFAGALVDRWDRRMTMVVSDLGRGLLVLVVALAHLEGKLRLWQIYAGVSALATVGVFFLPAKMALLPQIVDRDNLMAANSLSEMTGQVLRLGGYALSGLLVAAAGPSGAMFFNAFSFLAGAGATWAIRLRKEAAKRDNPGIGRVFAEVREGLGFLARRRGIASLVLVGAVGNVGMAPVLGLPAVLATQVLRASIRGYGFLQASLAAGMLVGSYIVGRFKLERLGTIFTIGFATQGLSELLVAASWSLHVAMAGYALFGMSSAFILVPLIAAVQATVPAQMAGRVFGSGMVMAGVCLPLAIWWAGLLADIVGVRQAFAAGGGVLLACSLLAGLLPAVRRFSLQT